MSFHSWLQSLRSALAPRRGQRPHRPNLEVLEDRCVLAQYAVTYLPLHDATDLNEASQVVGNAGSHAFLRENGTSIDLGTLGGSYSHAEAINDLGQVVGTAGLPGDTSAHAFLITPQGGEWFRDSDQDGRNDFMIDLGTLNGSNDSGATDINNAGQVVGDSGYSAFLWDAVNGMVGLGGSGATGINEIGQVTGAAGDPWLWDAASGTTLLDTGPDYIYTSVAAINDAGQIVGYQLYASDPFANALPQAFVWTPDTPNGITGRFSYLYSPGAINSSAADINNYGQVVGSMTTEGFENYVSYAVRWDSLYAPPDILQNQLLPEPGSNVTLESAQAINDHGAILAGRDNGSAQYLLTLVPPGTPTIGIVDAPAVTEGNAGTRAATFTLTLSAASTQPVTVAYATADGNATAGSDYQAASGTLTIPAGQTTGTITVLVNGDRLAEPNETFVVNLGAPTNATIADGQSVGTIVDDEPRISVGDVTKKEGNGKKTTLFTFTVTLSAAYDQPVTISFQTVNGTATTGDNDYLAKTGTLTFATGETTETITIEVKGDSKKEANETFYLELFGNSSNSLFTKNRGIGTILNDD